MIHVVVMSLLLTGVALGAQLVDAKGAVIGYASVFDKGSGLVLKLTAEHLPVGWHAVHIHAHGDCSDYAQGFIASGSHFNPHNTAYGAHDKQRYHAGDLANVFVGESGSVQIEQIVPGMTAAEYRGFFQEQGPALIIHQDPDDYLTQPTGDVGERIACAVLPVANQLDPQPKQPDQQEKKALHGGG